MTQQHIHRGWGRWLLAAWVGVLAACGGGGGSSSSNEVPTVSAPQAEGLNVQAVRVGPGPVGAPRVANVLYTQVRVCAPNDASNCQIIDHVLVDTGSTGLRLLKSAVTPTLRAALPGNNLYSCVQFLDGSYMWGPVVKADVSMGGDQLRNLTAGSLPIQLVINSAELPAPAGGCAGSSEDQAERSNDDVSKLGANGILGIGTDPQDCGNYCTIVQNNGRYYTDTPTVTGTTVALTEQVQQPVSRFASDNNGTVIELPSVPATGASVANGWLIFGIGTQSNNALGSATVFRFTNPSQYAQFFTAYGAKTGLQGFIDSGSNGLFFGSRSEPAFAFCADGADPSPWYCPASTVSLAVTNRSLVSAGTTSAVDLPIANATALFSNTAAYAYSNLAGDIGRSDLFDFGLPFFYGRRIFTGMSMDGQAPYVAY